MANTTTARQQYAHVLLTMYREAYPSGEAIGLICQHHHCCVPLVDSLEVCDMAELPPDVGKAASEFIARHQGCSRFVRADVMRVEDLARIAAHGQFGDADV